MKLSFYGGAHEVTGACYRIESKKTKILIDCGLFQGCDECADLNFENFKFNPAEIHALFVTHAHLDHIGRIPKLVKEGFAGRIVSTAPTRDLSRLILEDALSLASRKNQQLYSEDDLKKTLSLWETLPYHKPIEIFGVTCEFKNAGHILGSSMVNIHAEEKHILFTGDLGNTPSVLLPGPEMLQDIEYLIIESAYGSKTHETGNEARIKLERAIEDVAARRGTLLIPAFATERTQEILFLLNEMLHFRRVPDIPVFVDAPLAIRVTEVYETYLDHYQIEIIQLFREHPNLFKFKKLQFTESVEESKHINDIAPPKVVVAGSGMMNGGRILHHLRRYVSDPQSILLVTGYQAAGSLGRRLIDHEAVVKIFGEEIPVHAEIRKIGGFSAHADNPQLFSFVEQSRDSLKRVFVVQGEEAQALHFSQEIKDRLGIQSDAPMLYDSFTL